MSKWAHQERAIAMVNEAWQTKRAPLLVLPCGSGKTRTACRIAKVAQDAGARVRFVVHRAELLTQTVKAAATEGLDGMVISSAQGMIARKEQADCDLLILDEARHYVADEWQSIPAGHTGRLLGLDATPERVDGRALGAQYDAIVCPTSVKELIAQSVLVPFRVFGPGAYQGRPCEHPNEALELHRGEWTRAIVFASNTTHAIDIASRCAVSGFRTRVVFGTTPEVERAESLALLRDGLIDVIVNVFLLTEGFDEPSVDCVVLARGCTSAGTYIQQVSRASRWLEGKLHALILDLVGAYDAYGMPDDDRVYSLEGIAIRPSGDRVDLRQCLVCGAVYETGPRQCDRCGAEHPKPKKPQLSRAAMKLVETSSYSAAHRLNPREALYETMKQQAEAKGHKPGFAKLQFYRQFGYWPKERKAGSDA